MKVKLLISIIFCSFFNIALSQVGIQSDSTARHHIRRMLSTLDTYHYTAEMHFKEIGVDTFETRKFTISYQSNPDNRLYGYDFEIAEHIPSGEVYSIIIKEDGFYILYTGSRRLTQRPLPDTVDPKSLLEYLRQYFILEEVLSTFLDEQTSIKATKDSIHLYLDVSESFTRSVMLDKQNYLPIRLISTFHDHDLVPLQLTEITFHFDLNYDTVPEHSLNPDHFIKAGYIVTFLLD